MFYIKFFFTFLFKVLINNPWKVIFLGIIIFCFNYVSNAELQEIKYPIIQKFVNDGKTHLVVKSGDSYSIKELLTDSRIVDNNLVFKEISAVFVILIVVGIVFSIIFLLTCFVPDEEVNWNFGDIWDTTKVLFVKSISEDDIYYYTYRGRLVAKKNYMLGEWDLEKLLSYPLNIYPPFEGTKADKRDKKIETIFKP
jgi:hypothetical protein